jgi:AraC-like DNA-binding protein
LPNLTIAIDCGFGSIGPFNRAFKQLVGRTPMAYRLSQR